MLVDRHCSQSLLLQQLWYWVQLAGRLQLVPGGRPGCLCFEHHVGVCAQQQPLAGEQEDAQGGEPEWCGGSGSQRQV